MIRFILAVWLLVTGANAQKIYATFDVAAQKSANVAFHSSGIVGKIFVDIGSVVQKGDMLAKLQNEETKAVLDIHQTALKFAKKDYNRQVKVRKIIDQAKFDSYENKYESSKAQVAYQKILLDKTILKAPFDGVIVSKEIETGDVVSGQMIKTAFKIQSSKKRKLILQFDQKYHATVKVGDIYHYKLDGDNNEYRGVVSKIYPYADTKTRKIKAEVLTDDILVGLFGDGYIQ